MRALIWVLGDEDGIETGVNVPVEKTLISKVRNSRTGHRLAICANIRAFKI